MATPWNGIGTYLRDVLLHMQQAEDHSWFLYSDRWAELPPNLNNSVLRHGNQRGALVSTAFAQWKFPQWAEQDQCDLFWSPRHQLPLGLSQKIPTVLSIHDLVFRSHPQTMRRTGWLLEKLLTPPSLRKADRVLVSSTSALKELGHYYPRQQSKSQVVLLSSALHEQPQTDVTTLALPAAPYFVFSGSLEPRKNIDRLLHAFEQVKEQHQIPHHLVLISGGGWNQNQTLNTIKRMKESVHLIEKITDAEKASVIRGAEFVALPSLHEGYGIPIAEGIKLGKPALTSDTASMPEVAGDAACYVNPESTASIAEALRRLCTDTNYLGKLTAAACARANTYSWLDCAQQTLATFHSVVKSRSLHG